MTLCLHPTHLKPAPAAQGLLCESHYTRLHAAIAQAPTLVAWVREHIPPSSQTTERVSGSRTPPAPLNIRAMDDADHLHAQLAGWALVVMEERPELHGPAMQGTRLTVTGEPAGIRSGHPTAGVCTWLLTHLDYITAQAWVGDMAREIPQQTRWMKKQYATEETAKRLPQPCPRCDHKSLHYTPPQAPGWPVLIQCRICTYIIPEDLYAHYTRVALEMAA